MKIISLGSGLLLALTTLYAHADSLYAYEYSSDYSHESRHNDGDDTYRSYKNPTSRYPQQSSQPPIIVYPNNRALQNQQERYLPRRMVDEQQEHEWREQEREEQYWRRRRWALEHQPHTRYDENQFNRDDTHW